jgi:hypothetical protein
VQHTTILLKKTKTKTKSTKRRTKNFFRNNSKEINVELETTMFLTR